MRTIPIILFGAGGVASALLRQILDHRAFHATTYGLTLSVVALCDRNGAVLAPQGIADQDLRDLLAYKATGGRLAQHPLGDKQNNPAAIVEMAGHAGTIVVDCTASTDTVGALTVALSRGYRIVLANKKPLTVEQEIYTRLTSAPAAERRKGEAIEPPVRHLGRCRWETTVGAGLPVIVTLNRLVASGDPVMQITGTFSGTLGYVMTGLGQGRPFSEIVYEAHKLGYTEPDPRDDLGGVDVARKALILARGIGWRLDLEDVEVNGLYPASMAALSVADFMAALPELDADFAAQVQTAKAQGQVLRYAAKVAENQCTVGPVLVPAESPLGRLTGTDNLVEFLTGWYSPNPLVIQGKGAGTDATAAGVLSDIIDLAYTN